MPAQLALNQPPVQSQMACASIARMSEHSPTRSRLSIADIALDQAVAALVLPPPGTPITPVEAKRLAVMVAYRGLGNVAPNPLVGAVCVDSEHCFISAGAHERVGHAHAEINAIAAAKVAGLRDQLKGGTMYVTLEPCAHSNRTPACAPQVVGCGVSSVVFGVVDPNPKVSGRGADLVNAAGVNCEYDPSWTAECSKLAEIFLWNMRHGSPFVGLKVATSMDGVMARQGDRRAWITGPRARAYGHFLRVTYDAILIGTGTLISDDPILDTRDSLWPGRSPVRVVLDPDGRGLKAKPDMGWRILSHAPEAVLWITCQQLDSQATKVKQALVEKGIQTITLPTHQTGTFAPVDILTVLHGIGVSSVLIEGGLGTYKPFLNAKAVNHLHLFQAPKLLGGNDALYFGAGTLESEFKNTRLTVLDGDWLMDADLTRGHMRQNP